jgi:serine/threonine protein phosphatase PrpC
MTNKTSIGNFFGSLFKSNEASETVPSARPKQEPTLAPQEQTPIKHEQALSRPEQDLPKEAQAPLSSSAPAPAGNHPVTAQPAEAKQTTPQPAQPSAPAIPTGKSASPNPVPSPSITPKSPFAAPPAQTTSQAPQAPQPIATPPHNQSQAPVLSKLKLSLPNAKVNQEYLEAVTALDTNGHAIAIEDIEIDTASGLRFDAKSSHLQGLPMTAGTVSLKIKWKNSKGQPFFYTMNLIVIADPKSLWNNIEPPESAPYFKKNTDSLFISEHPVRIAAASRRGRSHEHSGSFRDDDFFIRTDPSSGWSTLIVADGAGSARFSRKGSEIATTEFGALILAATTGDRGTELTNQLERWDDSHEAQKSISAHFQKLFQEASVAAIKKIDAEAQSIPTNAKDYSTTLLVAVTKRIKTRTFIVAFWVGDGVIAAYGPSGKVRIMGKPDGGEHAGQTVFLDARVVMDGPSFFKRITMGFFNDITSVLLMTDGVSDPRFETDSELSDASKWDALWSEISPLLFTQSPEQALLNWLEFYSPKHHDDRTIAVLW